MSQPLWDRWSLIHVTSGALFTIGFWALDVQWMAVLFVFAIECAWEVFENNSPGIWLWKQLGYSDYAGDSLPHTLFDVVVTTAGSAAAALALDTAGLVTGSIIVGGVAVVLMLGFFYYLAREKRKLAPAEENQSQSAVMKGLMF